VQQSDHVDEGGKRAHRIGAAAEAEQKDVVAILVLLGEEFIGAENLVIEP